MKINICPTSDMRYVLTSMDFFTSSRLNVLLSESIETLASGDIISLQRYGVRAQMTSTKVILHWNRLSALIIWCTYAQLSTEAIALTSPKSNVITLEDIYLELVFFIDSLHLQTAVCCELKSDTTTEESSSELEMVRQIEWRPFILSMTLLFILPALAKEDVLK